MMTASTDNASEKKQSKLSKFASILNSIFDVAKKFVDDEVYYMFKSLFGGNLSKLTESILMGVLMIFVFCQEGYEAIKDVIDSLTNKKSEQRKTRVVTGALILATALTGIGLIGAIIAESLGAEVAGIMFMPVVLPALMVGIYSLALGRCAYKLSVVKKKEQEAREIYEAQIQSIEAQKAQLKLRLEDLEQQYRNVQEKIDEYLKKFINVEPTAKERNEYLSNLVAKVHIDEEIKKNHAEEKNLDEQKEKHRQSYQPFLDERLDAEREVAFATIELATSSVVLASAILGASFLIGASVLSLGTVAMALLFTGVIVGGAAKLFEWVDEKKGHACTRWLRGLFTSSPKPTNDVMYEKKSEFAPYIVPAAIQPIDIPSTTRKMLSEMPASQSSTPINAGTPKEQIHWEQDRPNFSPPGRVRHHLFRQKSDLETLDKLGNETDVIPSNHTQQAFYL